MPKQKNNEILSILSEIVTSSELSVVSMTLGNNHPQLEYLTSAKK